MVPRMRNTLNEEYKNMLFVNSQLDDDEIDVIDWFCNKCQISKLAQLFPFGLENDHNLINIMNSDS